MFSYKCVFLLNNPEAKSLLNKQKQIFGFNLGQKFLLHCYELVRNLEPSKVFYRAPRFFTNAR